MESLNLNTLVNSLPNGQQNAEKELLNDFKGIVACLLTDKGGGADSIFAWYSRGTEHNHAVPLVAQELEAGIQQRVLDGVPGYAELHPAGGLSK